MSDTPDDTRPNQLALRFLRWFCPASLVETVEGDLIERFETDVQEIGERKARNRLAWNVIWFLRPGIVLRNTFSAELSELSMFQNYFKIVIRNLLKRKLYSFINIVGLALGMTVFLLIGFYVWNERSYDNFHVKRDRI